MDGGDGAAVKDLIPRAILSAPKEGPIVPSSTKSIGAARAPALSNKANSEASAGESNPVILNWLARADCIVARLIILLSK